MVWNVRIPKEPVSVKLKAIPDLNLAAGLPQAVAVSQNKSNDRISLYGIT